MKLNVLKREILFYQNNVSENVHRLLVSRIIKAISTPLAEIFLNAFIWRVTGSLVIVSLYNLGQFIFLPLAFYLNGILLKKFHIRKLFALGIILTGLSSLLVVIVGGSSYYVFFLLGSLVGVSIGFYYANLNYLEFQETISEGRNYYYGFLTSVHSLINIVVPLISGWFIVCISSLNLLNIRQAYWVIFGTGFLLMLLSARIILVGKFETPTNNKITLPTQHFWIKRRIFCIASGCVDSISYLGPVLVLYFLGNEGMLGGISSVIALFTAIGLYIYGRTVKSSQTFKSFIVVVIMFFICSMALIVLPNPFNVLSYVISIGIILGFSNLFTSSLFLSFADDEINGDKSLRYAVTFDNELFLNLGRIISVGIILILAIVWSQSGALIYGSLFVSIFLLVLTFLIKRLMHTALVS